MITCNEYNRTALPLSCSKFVQSRLLVSGSCSKCANRTKFRIIRGPSWLSSSRAGGKSHQKLARSSPLQYEMRRGVYCTYHDHARQALQKDEAPNKGQLRLKQSTSTPPTPPTSDRITDSLLSKPCPYLPCLGKLHLKPSCACFLDLNRTNWGAEAMAWSIQTTKSYGLKPKARLSPK